MKLTNVGILVTLLIPPFLMSEENKPDTPHYSLQRLALQHQSNFKNESINTVNKAKMLGLPIRGKNILNQEVVLQRFRGNRPLYYKTDNLNAADTVSSDEVWSGGSLGLNLSGFNQVIGIWDGGSINETHQEFLNFIDIIDQASVSNHSTHVAGTMVAFGINPSAKGMAFESTLKSYEFNFDTLEMTQAQLDTEPITISNHSYSYISGWFFDFFNDNRWAWFGDVNTSSIEDPLFGFYDDSSMQWDEIAYLSPEYLIVKSAGNDRNEQGVDEHWHFDGNLGYFILGNDVHPADGGASGFDSIAGGSASAKNILTIGSVSDIIGGYQSVNDISINYFSGWGPTDDGRIKPDIVANGINLFSPVATNNSSYAIYSGTSMSSAVVSGSLALLSQHAENLFSSKYRSATLKALVIHTADEAGAALGPDYTHGWGLLNTSSAASIISIEALSLATEHIHEVELFDGNTINLNVNGVNNSPIKVTIVWTDHPGLPVALSVDPTNLMLVNDLDLRVTAPNSQIFMPWVLDPLSPQNPASTGDNFRDNIEQIVIQSPVVGVYQLEISHKNNLLNGASQLVSIIITGNIPGEAPTITSSPTSVATIDVPYSYDSDSMVEA
ncbi:MAG: S8 family serine peptidase, partial [Colwellia sp.]|uniref:S8 family serine peptidase n=1 Tax=Colwellia sp. TaxID=56799 RepID=UPI0025C3FB5B